MSRNPGAVRAVAAQFAAFAIFGAVSTVAQYTILIALVQFADLKATLASGIGFVVGAVVNYTLNRRFTFRSDARHAVALPKFTGVATVGLLLNTLVLGGLVGLGLHYIPAQFVATGIVLCWNFCLNRAWTFRYGSSADR